MSQQMIQVNGVELCAESFGDRADPALLLIQGVGSSMDWWDDGLCARLAAGGRFVIRYDNRDTGRSVSFEPGAPPYSLTDLASDAVGVLDDFGLATAHIVGVSMGGMIAQLVALDHPDRVASLTLVSTSPANPSAGEADLPGIADELLAFFDVPPPGVRYLRWDDEAGTTSRRQPTPLPLSLAGWEQPQRT